MRWSFLRQDPTSPDGPQEPAGQVVDEGRALLWPDRACCCPAVPIVKVVVPPTSKRPRPVDLFLCGHHYRASWGALDSVDATVHDVQGTLITSPAQLPS